jgi:hypothetical protein
MSVQRCFRTTLVDGPECMDTGHDVLLVHFSGGPTHGCRRLSVLVSLFSKTRGILYGRLAAFDFINRTMFGQRRVSSRGGAAGGELDRNRNRCFRNQSPLKSIVACSRAWL